MKKEKTKDTNLYIYGIYTKIINTEKHYTVAQVKNKSMASYWLLIIFAAIGISFSTQEIGLPFDPFICSIILSIIGIIGIYNIWYEDLIINERFLNINHLEGQKYETIYSWLPKIHIKYLCFTHKAMLRLKVLFYIGCNIILFLAMIIASVIYFKKYHWAIPFLLVSIEFIFFISLTKKMFTKTYKNEFSTLEEIIHEKR